MELGAKDFFMVISLLKLLQIYCTKHIIVVLDSKAKNFFFAHKSTFIQQMLESQYNSDIFFDYPKVASSNTAYPFKSTCRLFPIAYEGDF